MSVLEIEIERFILTDLSTIGKLTINGTFICYTLEDKDRDLKSTMSIKEINEKKVKTKTCVPYGKYPITVSVFGDQDRAQKLGGRQLINNQYSLPLMIQTPGFSGCFIHLGNNNTHTEGCLLTGKTYIKTGRSTGIDYILSNSLPALNDVFDQIESQWQSSQKMTIEFIKSATVDDQRTGNVDKSSSTSNTVTSNDNNGDINNDSLTNSLNKELNPGLTNIEADNVNNDVFWGKKNSPNEVSDWVSLKQFLLYLSQRFVPQSLYPFIELIPNITATASSDPSTSVQNDISGVVDSNVKTNLGAGNKTPEGDTAKALEKTITKIGDQVSQVSDGTKQNQTNKFGSIPPVGTGYNKERFDAGVKATNDSIGVTDLLSLDPFKEGIKALDISSESGLEIKKKRNLGYRIYGQLVLSPEPINGVTSKTGAVGFQSLNIDAGSSQESAGGRVTLELLDVQGNKFLDINSPWTVIFATNAGSKTNNFWFRYGWQIRVPLPNDKSDKISDKFWNHEGWKLFGDEVKKEIQRNILPHKQVITLTQSINVGPSLEGDLNLNRIALFDEGVEEAADGTITISKNTLNGSNYLALTNVNPELSINPDGSISAKLTLYTTGSIIGRLPLYVSTYTKSAVHEAIQTNGNNTITLADLMIGIILDIEYSNLPALTSETKKQLRRDYADRRKNALAKSGRFDGYIYVTGDGPGQEEAEVDPSTVVLTIPQEVKTAIFSNQPASNSSGESLLWAFNKLLSANNCHLIMSASGSGNGINNIWHIVVPSTQVKSSLKKTNQTGNDGYTKLVSLLSSEKDVFSYRFQGTLMESLKFDKTETLTHTEIENTKRFAQLSDGGVKTLNGKEVIDTLKERESILNIYFASLTHVEINCLCHPWVSPGRNFYLKGTGYLDGLYKTIQVTHRLTGTRFITTIKGIRFVDPNSNTADKQNSSEDGNGNFAQGVNVQKTNEVLSAPVLNSGNTVSPSTNTLPDALVTVEDLLRIRSDKTKDQLAPIIEPFNDMLKEYSLNSYLRVCHVVSQVFAESGFTRFIEFSSGSQYENDLNLGNTQAGDGVKFKGRGGIQVTGRKAYQSATDSLGVDFISTPSLLEKPIYAMKSIGWFWTVFKKNKKQITITDEKTGKPLSLNISLLEASDTLLVRAVTRIVNGKEDGVYTHLERRKTYFETCKTVFLKILAKDLLNNNMIVSNTLTASGQTFIKSLNLTSSQITELNNLVQSSKN